MPLQLTTEKIDGMPLDNHPWVICSQLDASVSQVAVQDVEELHQVQRDSVSAVSG